MPKGERANLVMVDRKLCVCILNQFFGTHEKKYFFFDANNPSLSLNGGGSNLEDLLSSGLGPGTGLMTSCTTSKDRGCRRQLEPPLSLSISIFLPPFPLNNDVV